jgi:hypothetical protein
MPTSAEHFSTSTELIPEEAIRTTELSIIEYDFISLSYITPQHTTVYYSEHSIASSSRGTKTPHLYARCPLRASSCL